MHAEFFQPF